MFPDHLASDLICASLFGILLVVLVGLGLKAIDWMWRKLDLEEQVQKGNIAAGIVMAACVLGLCYGVSTVIKSIAGGT